MVIESLRANSGESEVKMGELSIRNTDKEKLLGVVLDNHLKFDHHTKKICNEARKRISALARKAPFLDAEKINC